MNPVPHPLARHANGRLNQGEDAASGDLVLVITHASAGASPDCLTFKHYRKLGWVHSNWTDSDGGSSGTDATGVVVEGTCTLEMRCKGCEAEASNELVFEMPPWVRTASVPRTLSNTTPRRELPHLATFHR